MIKDYIDISKISIIIVGNKCDLPDSERIVDKEMKKILKLRIILKSMNLQQKKTLMLMNVSMF